MERVATKRRWSDWLYQNSKRVLGSRLLVARVIAKKIEEPPIERNNPSLDVRAAKPEELRVALENAELDITPSFLESALARDDLCIGAFDEGRMVAYSWVAFDGAPHGADTQVVVPSPFVYIYKSFCLASHRGRSVMRDVGWVRDRAALDRGRTHVIGFIELANTSSMRAYSKAGGKPIGLAGLLRLGKFPVTFRTRSVAAVGFRFVRRSAA